MDGVDKGGGLRRGVREHHINEESGLNFLTGPGWWGLRGETDLTPSPARGAVHSCVNAT